MILIADSGSTKCDWVLVSDNREEIRVNTIGFNPYFHTAQFISDTISETSLKGYSSEVKVIWYYGTGCSSFERNTTVLTALKAIFPEAEIHINHDLAASAIATCGHERGIACILGTGSNACLYNGKTLEAIQAVFGIGYILGDEGSGCHLGKTLLKRWLYNQMPVELSAKLKQAYSLTKDEMLETVYKKPAANVYLASFTRFIHDYIHEPFMQQLVKDCFREFLRTHIPQFPGYHEIPVHFVGSIAFYFEDLLKQSVAEEGFNMGIIIKQPIDNLVKFHAGI